VWLKIFDRDLIDNPRGKVKTIKVLFKTALPDQIKTTSGTLDNAHFRSWLLSILVKPFKKKELKSVECITNSCQQRAVRLSENSTVEAAHMGDSQVPWFQTNLGQDFTFNVISRTNSKNNLHFFFFLKNK